MPVERSISARSSGLIQESKRTRELLSTTALRREPPSVPSTEDAREERTGECARTSDRRDATPSTSRGCGHTQASTTCSEARRTKGRKDELEAVAKPVDGISRLACIRRPRQHASAFAPLRKGWASASAERTGEDLDQVVAGEVTSRLLGVGEEGGGRVFDAESLLSLFDNTLEGESHYNRAANGATSEVAPICEEARNGPWYRRR